MDEELVRSDDEMSVAEFCAKKLQSFNESDLTKLVCLSDESVSKIMGDECLQEYIASAEIGILDVLEAGVT